MWYDYVLIGLAILFVLLIIIVLIRAALFVDKTNYNLDVPFETSDEDIVYKLGELIKIPTVSHEDVSLTDFSMFEKYIEKVKELYPTVFEKCEFTQTKEYALKFYLKGKFSEKPNLLMAHYDVVPVTEGWDHDPFLGEVVDGYLYGRGTLDTKNTMACALSALEAALKKGYQPVNDLYLCFGANEEIYGDSQVKLVEEFKKAGIRFNLVFDEGGGILKNAFPGVKEDTAFLGVVEKGMINVKLTLDTNGGHSSSPKRNGPAIRLSKALLRLEKHQMKARFTQTSKEMLNIMGRHSLFALKIVLGNMWLFQGLVKSLFPLVSADINALLRSSLAFTIVNGGNQTNIIPNHVEANVNVRVAPFDTPDEVLKHVKKVIKDDKIVVTGHDINKMYPECSFKQEGYEIIKQTTLETYKNTVVSPFIMLGGTDARHYNEVSSCVIRFSPMRVSNEDRKGVHGLNERIEVDSLKKCLEFYERLLTKL